MIAALGAALDSCDDTGWNLPELLRLALTDLARAHGGTEALVRHRADCWEADHVRELAAEADWQALGRGDVVSAFDDRATWPPS
jgi:hypothetical protein